MSLGIIIAFLGSAPVMADKDTTDRAKQFVEAHTKKLRPLEVAAGRAWWDANVTARTRIQEEGRHAEQDRRGSLRSEDVRRDQGSLREA